MGGQLIKGYSIEGDSLCHVGLHRSWKLYKGHNSSTHLSASIFLIQKKQLKKSEREDTIKFAKKQSTSLLRVRHPGVLAVIQPLTEDQNILAFVTEKIEGNFTHIIKQNRFQEFIASQLQLKLFLYPFIETLTFIHDALKQAHLEISFDSIFVTAEGKWKLAGFGHNLQLTSDQLVQYDEKVLDYSFAAPEVALQQSYCKTSDSFSLGLLILRLLQSIHKINQSHGPCSDKQQYQKLNGFSKNISDHAIIAKSKNPGELSQLLKELLCWDPARRSNCGDVLYSSWMNDSTLMTVKYLDKINNYESKQQLDFLKGLAGVLDDFPQRVTNRIVVPKLLDLLKFNTLIASIIYIVIDLLKKKKIEEQVFKKAVWPSLKTVTQGKEMTAQAIYLLVINIEIFQKNLAEAEITSYLMPLYLKCYDCPPKLKQLALSMLQKICKKVQYQYVKTKIIPKLMVLLKDPSIEIRKDTLKGLYSILHLIDNQTVSVSILPGLEAARRAGSDPFINAIITHMHKKLGQSLPIQILSSKILPTLIPYLTEPSLSRTEFLQFKSLIFQMIQRIEKESSKQFDNNSLQNFAATFSDSDFKFKQTDTTPTETKKGDYNFLSNYLQPKTEPTPITQSPEIKTPSQSLPSPSPAANFTFPQTTQPQTPTYQFDSLPTDYSNNFFATVSTPTSTNPPPAELPKKIEEKDPYLDIGYFESVEAKKIEQHEIKPEKPKVIENPKFLSGANLDQKSPLDSTYTPPSPPKQDRKIVGGASGPMEIKKLKGPPPPGSKPKKPIEPSLQAPSGMEFNFEKKEEPAFKMSFENYDNFSLGPQPTVEKKEPPSYSNSFNFQNPMFSNKPSESNNPFEEIEKENPPMFFPGIKPGTAIPQNQDIYSYFDSESKPGSSAAPKNSFDLI